MWVEGDKIQGHLGTWASFRQVDVFYSTYTSITSVLDIQPVTMTVNAFTIYRYVRLRVYIRNNNVQPKIPNHEHIFANDTVMYHT